MMSETEEVNSNPLRLSRKLETMRYQSEPKQFRTNSKNFSKVLENDLNAKVNDAGYSLKTAISDLIDYNVMQGKSGLQNKIDYFITPYNKNIDMNEFMQFSDKLLNWWDLKEAAMKDWKAISNFILNNNK